ncbi:hypothetical protein J6590_094109 [Homalodisca vitripennis]|nr:hypothetical protein J6590_094109 [Homalodisca vitripennis]
MPLSIKKEKSLSRFKILSKDYLLCHCFYSVAEYFLYLLRQDFEASDLLQTTVCTRVTGILFWKASGRGLGLPGRSSVSEPQPNNSVQQQLRFGEQSEIGSPEFNQSLSSSHPQAKSLQAALLVERVLLRITPRYSIDSPTKQSPLQVSSADFAGFFCQSIWLHSHDINFHLQLPQPMV